MGDDEEERRTETEGGEIRQRQRSPHSCAGTRTGLYSCAFTATASSPPPSLRSLPSSMMSFSSLAIATETPTAKQTGV